ncbi:MAG: hypothetical protein ABI064_03075 [Acidobacteriaceae bacterium]
MFTLSTLLWVLFILLAVGVDVQFFAVVQSKLVTDPAVMLLSLFLLMATQAISVFIGVVISTGFPTDDEDGIHQHGYAARSVWFGFVALAMVAAFAVTIPFYPYIPKVAATQGSPAIRVPVIAQQFSFLMPSKFPVGRRIIFEVTSRDVNHDFGIYDSEGELVAQVQAMPNYVNDLEVTFHKPGNYTVRCLEYCGVGHAGMEKNFTVEGH